MIENQIQRQQTNPWHAILGWY